MPSSFTYGHSGQRRSHRECRQCSRCGLPLTDPPSMERGIGPICARQDTKLFSLTIPADLGQAILLLNIVKEEEIPNMPPSSECSRNPFDVFKTLKTEVGKIAAESISSAIRSGKNIRFMTGNPLGEYAKMIDFICSFKINGTTKMNLIRVVKAFGFPALAAVLAGEASTGESEVSFDETTGFLVLKGSRSKAGFSAWFPMKVKGVVLPTYAEPRTYRVPAKLFAEFNDIVSTYWPMFANGTMEKVVEKAEAWVVAHPDVPVVLNTEPGKLYFPASTNGKSATILERQDNLVVCTTKYDPNMYSFFSGLPRASRRWNAQEKGWIVNKQHFEAVKTALSANEFCFNVGQDLTAATSTSTTTKPSSGRYYRRR